MFIVIITALMLMAAMVSLFWIADVLSNFKSKRSAAIPLIFLFLVVFIFGGMTLKMNFESENLKHYGFPATKDGLEDGKVYYSEAVMQKEDLVLVHKCGFPEEESRVIKGISKLVKKDQRFIVKNGELVILC